MKTEKLKLDKVDMKILNILQRNGKITNLQLSKDIALSPAPTLERVKKLEKHGYIKSYHACIDKQKMGLGITAFMQISMMRQDLEAVTKFLEVIDSIPQVIECYNVTGDYDYLLKIMVKDIAAFDKMVRERLAVIPAIANMHTKMVLSENKNTRIVPFGDA